MMIVRSGCITRLDPQVASASQLKGVFSYTSALTHVIVQKDHFFQFREDLQ